MNNNKSITSTDNRSVKLAVIPKKLFGFTIILYIILTIAIIISCLAIRYPVSYMGIFYKDSNFNSKEKTLKVIVYTEDQLEINDPLTLIDTNGNQHSAYIAKDLGKGMYTIQGDVFILQIQKKSGDKIHFKVKERIIKLLIKKIK